MENDLSDYANRMRGIRGNTMKWCNYYTTLTCRQCPQCHSWFIPTLPRMFDIKFDLITGRTLSETETCPEKCHLCKEAEANLPKFQVDKLIMDGKVIYDRNAPSINLPITYHCGVDLSE
jgi:hypothetical protein